MEIIKKKILSKEYIFLLFIALNPILDIIYTLTEYYIQVTIPINQAVRIGFLAYLLYSFNLKKYFKYIFIFSGILAINELTYIIRGLNFSLVGNLGYDAKIISIIIYIFATYELLKSNNIGVKELVKAISISTLIIVSGILIPSVLGISLSTYGASDRFGIKGLFNAQNAITATLLIQLPMVSVTYLYYKEKRYLILYFIGIIVLNLIGTKVGSAGSIFILFTTLVFIILDRFRRKINFKKFITIIFSIISIGMIGICIFFNKIIITLNNLPYNKFEFPTFFSYLVSNRDAQIKILHQYIIHSENKILNLICGLGNTQGNDVLKDTQIGFQLIEMDFNAIYYYSGIIITSIIVSILIYSAFNAFKNILIRRSLTESLLGLSLFVGMIHLILGGHVLFEAIANIYLSVVIAIIIYNTNIIREESKRYKNREKKRILFIGWTLTAGGGVETILEKLISALPKNKYDIDLFEYIDFGVSNLTYKQGIKKLPSVLKYPKDKGFINRKFFALKEKILDSMIRVLPRMFRSIYIREYYNIEIACTYLTPSFILVNKRNGKNITWIHGPLHNFDYKNKKSILKKFISFYLYKRQERAFNVSDHIVVISNTVYESVVSLYPKYKEKVVKIYNGYNIEVIKSKSIKDDINFEKTTILSVGRLDKNKNHKILIESCNELRKVIKNFQIIIIGEGEERKSLEKLIRELDLEEYVKLYGYKSNPYPYINKADVFVMTSFSEGFPTVVAEAMILKTPVIMTRVSGSDELTQDGKCGIVVERNVKSITHAVLNILLNEEKKNYIINNAYENINNYSVEKQKVEFEKVFNF